MSRTARTWLLAVVAVVALLQMPSAAMAVDCAFEDKNNNNVFDAGDAIVPDAAWLGGAPFTTAFHFVVPVGCNKVLATVPLPSQSVVVNAAKITFLGKLEYLPAGGRGVVLNAAGDLIVGDGTNPALIRAGGVNTLPATTIAVAQKSVALIGGGNCTFKLATIEGTAPIQNTKVGILCTNDLTFVGSSVIGSKVNIQSLTGQIIASGTSAPGGFSLAALCDDPVTNLTANGNGNGISDAPDFPCTLDLSGFPPINFADPIALAAACKDLQTPPGVANSFQAFNDPLIMIAGAGANKNLDVQGASIVGRYRVVLAAEDGTLLLQNAVIDHGEQLGLTPPGGAKTFLFANPASIVRLPVDREDFIGPSTGSINITGTCLRSANAVVFGTGATVTGAPAPPPCAQFPADFVAQVSAFF